MELPQNVIGKLIGEDLEDSVPECPWAIDLISPSARAALILLIVRYEMTQFCLTSFAHDKSLSTPFENSFDDKLRQIKSVLAYCAYI